MHNVLVALQVLSGSGLSFCTIIHYSFHCSRYNIHCMWCLAAVCFNYWFYRFFPTSSWFECSPPITTSPRFASSIFRFSNVRVWRRIQTFFQYVLPNLSKTFCFNYLYKSYFLVSAARQTWLI
jgi:hypothetical protein